MEKLYGKGRLSQENAHYFLGDSLRGQGKLSEAEAQYREAIEIRTREVGDDTTGVPDGLMTLAGLLREEGKLVEWNQCLEQAAALFRRIPSRMIQSSNILAGLAERQGDNKEFTAAERAARGCLEIREQQIPDDWRTFSARSYLGVILLEQKRYTDCEPLLLSGYNGLKEREATIPRVGKVRLKQTAECLVKLYEAAGQDDKAAQWKATAAEIEVQDRPVDATKGGPSESTRDSPWARAKPLAR
jgi:tetratricopeptide (TPR) repeat protein